MNAAEIQACWGIPAWTNSDAYPEHGTDAVWRWEFLRRHPDYRDAWLKWRERHIRPLPVMGLGISYVVTDNVDKTRLRFGVSVIYDPRVSMSDDLISRAGVFHTDYNRGVSLDHESLVRLGAALANRPSSVDDAVRRLRQEDAEFTDYRFRLTEPLEPQIRKARELLMRLQEERLGKKKNTPRPSRELWPLYLRVLDARECGASWKIIGKTFWGGDTAKDKARRTYESAIVVRDNFPI